MKRKIDNSKWEVLKGSPNLLGASWDGDGVNFAIYSANAKRVELCLFNSVHAKHEAHRIELKEKTNDVWHAYIKGVQPNQLYAYRVDGDFNPKLGLRFDPYKLLLDPYARSIARCLQWDESLFSYPVDSGEDLVINVKDSASYAPLAQVFNDNFDWGSDSPLSISWSDTVIYEAHVKGITALHPDIEPKKRGTFLALSDDVMLEHFKKIGISAVELLPVHYRIKDWHLAKLGLDNYWGYNSIGYFAPDPRFAYDKSDGGVFEFKSMVKALHAAGIEVILDVVYNHSGEGNHLGPCLSFRGIDNASYYRLDPDNPRFYRDYTGCGNTLDTRNPWVVKLIMDSLRYWVNEMHVDGFRFDLMSALARESDAFDAGSGLLDAIHQDPVVSKVKLISESWDIGSGGYQVGAFSNHWSEWNDKYRQTVRSFWKKDSGIVGDFATRLTGSKDAFGRKGRTSFSSINFVACHDGFTLLDLVSYAHKHNEANGERNGDGDNNNQSFNCGVEGETKDQEVIELRNRLKRSMFATLMLSQGVPMILGGDEISRTQKGNNNAYCQDNEISWFNWSFSKTDSKFLEFCKEFIAYRKSQPLLRQGCFLKGENDLLDGLKDISWIHPLGKEMQAEDWHNSALHSFGMLLAEKQNPLSEDTVLLTIFNSDSKEIKFQLPRLLGGGDWLLVVDTNKERFEDKEKFVREKTYLLEGHALAVLVLKQST